MRKLVTAAIVVAALAAALAGWAQWASSSGGPAYEPVLDPANFSTVIDNPYFPLPVGRTLVYQGVKDGQNQEDRVTVTNQTKLVAEGITARVVPTLRRATAACSRRHLTGTRRTSRATSGTSAKTPRRTRRMARSTRRDRGRPECTTPSRA
jgi:hypothetical protein